MTERIAFAAKVTAEGRNIRGAVQLAGQRNKRGGEWVEVDPAAIVKADASKVIGVFEHDPDKLLASPENDTLVLRRNDQGIEFEFLDLPNTTAANDALELVQRGYVNGSSFQIDNFRSTFSTDPVTGERTRRITSIGRLIDVSPVRNPFFEASSAAAFSKEYDVTDVIDKETPAPEPPPAPEPKAPAQFAKAPADGKSETYHEAEAFARKRSLGDVETFMDNVYVRIASGEASTAERDQYDAFAKVYDERKAEDAEAKERQERIKLAHEMRRGLIKRAPEAGLFASDDYTAAFSQYLRTGNDRVMEQFAQTIAGDGTQGGFTVPDGFIAKLGERLKEYGGIAAVAQEITTSTGESLRWPYIDDTGNKAQIVSEDTQATSGADLVFDSIELGAYEYDATGASGNPIEVSLPLLQDSAFDIEALLLRLLGQRIGRKQADNFATGTGVNEPVGLLSKTADTMTATATSLAVPEHILQVDAAYRNSGDARWVMSDTSLNKAWTAQATTNEPLFLPGRTINGKPFDTLYGYPITIDPSAGNLVAFGDINAGYIIRRVRGVQLLVDPYTAQKKRAVQYHAWARADGNIQDPNAYSVSDWSGVSADT